MDNKIILKVFDKVNNRWVTGLSNLDSKKYSDNKVFPPKKIYNVHIENLDYIIGLKYIKNIDVYELNLLDTSDDIVTIILNKSMFLFAIMKNNMHNKDLMCSCKLCYKRKGIAW